MTIREVQLREVVDLVRDAVEPSAIGPTSRYVGLEHLDSDGGISAATVRSGELKSQKFAFGPEHILFGKLRPYLRKIARPDFIGICSTDIIPILPGPDVDRDYLYHQLRSPTLVALANSRTSGANLPRLNPRALLDLPIMLPPLAEQRRIAGVLDRVEGVRGMRQRSASAIQSLRKSTFMHVVGDAHPDYTEWPEHTIKELVAPGGTSLKTGPFGSALRHSEFVGEGVAVLGIDNAVANEFRWSERRYITPEKYKQLTRYTVRPGDVIVTLMGTIGRSSVVPEECPVAVSTKHLAVISVDQTRVLPLFLSYAIHSSPSIARQLGVATRGAIMPALNLGIIKSLRVRVPPLALQMRLVQLLGRIAKVEERTVHSAVSLDGLYGGLAARAFGGRK